MCAVLLLGVAGGGRRRRRWFWESFVWFWCATAVGVLHEAAVFCCQNIQAATFAAMMWGRYLASTGTACTMRVPPDEDTRRPASPRPYLSLPYNLLVVIFLPTTTRTTMTMLSKRKPERISSSYCSRRPSSVFQCTTQPRPLMYPWASKCKHMYADRCHQTQDSPSPLAPTATNAWLVNAYCCICT